MDGVMSEIERANKITSCEQGVINAAVIAIEVAGKRFLFSGLIDGFDIEPKSNLMDITWQRLFPETWGHDLTVHFIGGFTSQVQEKSE